MIRRTMVVVAIALATLAFGSTVEAGGWASVRLADGQAAPIVGQPWTATLIVKQHDLTAIDVDRLAVHFVAERGGAALDAEGVSTGELGHYRMSVTFPSAGMWNWTATPDPFPAIAMAALTVADGSAANRTTAPTASLVTGTCAAPGGTIGTLHLTPADDANATIVATGITTELVFLTKYTAAGSIAVLISDGGQPGTTLACGELAKTDLATPAVVLLAAIGDSGMTGTLALVPSGEDVVGSLVIVAVPEAPGITIRITDEGQGMFQPASVTIPVGTRVTWINESTLSHTVSGKSDGFASSGVLAPGERFGQTFATAGVYSYACDPHPWMTGEVTVV
jgi:plastocyanin